MRHCLCTLLCVLAGTFPVLGQQATQPNIVVIVADDFGLDLVNGYRDVLLAEREIVDPNCANNPDCAPDPPCTPNLDALMGQGVRFTRTWANPRCSPTRAQILTGLHSFRTGIGEITDQNEELRFHTKPLPWALAEAGYASAAVGKWHFNREAGDDYPWDFPTQRELLTVETNPRCDATEYHGAGFDYFAGSAFNLNRTNTDQPIIGSYTDWEKNFNGLPVGNYCVYATTDTVEDAIALLNPEVPLPGASHVALCQGPTTAGVPLTDDYDLSDQGLPWFLYVAMNAPHLPAHTPSDSDERLCPGLHDADLAGCYVCDDPILDARDARYLQVRAMVEAMDLELGRLLEEVDLDKTFVIFIGDNGSDPDAIAPRWLAEDSPWQCVDGKAKGTPYEQGLRVPLIVAGPGVPSGQTRDALVSATDLYATICDLIGSRDRPRDSISFVPHLFADDAPHVRTSLYSERFWPNFDAVCSSFRETEIERHFRTLRGDRFKLIRTKWRETGCRTNRLELYDLLTDPFEEHNLLEFPGRLRDPGVLAPASYDDYCALRCQMIQMGVDLPRVDDVCGLCDACIDPDLDGDFDLADINVMLGEFGSRDGAYGSDLNKDGDVTVEDLAILLGRFGDRCE